MKYDIPLEAFNKFCNSNDVSYKNTSTRSGQQPDQAFPVNPGAYRSRLRSWPLEQSAVEGDRDETKEAEDDDL